jgi:hypothetical protein
MMIGRLRVAQDEDARGRALWSPKLGLFFGHFIRLFDLGD